MTLARLCLRESDGTLVRMTYHASAAIAKRAAKRSVDCLTPFNFAVVEEVDGGRMWRCSRDVLVYATRAVWEPYHLEETENL